MTELRASNFISATFSGYTGSQGPIGYTGSSANADQVDGYDVVVISALPGSPATNTIYFITG